MSWSPACVGITAWRALEASCAPCEDESPKVAPGLSALTEEHARISITMNPRAQRARDPGRNVAFLDNLKDGAPLPELSLRPSMRAAREIGRASCRERG